VGVEVGEGGDILRIWLKARVGGRRLKGGCSKVEVSEGWVGRFGGGMISFSLFSLYLLI
jgi:hypothetical protein